MERKRSANISPREKEFLLTLVEKYFNIIENKKTNSVFNKQKIECWEKLAREFNSSQTTGLRTGSQLKATYEKMKQLAKQHKAEEKVEILRTGGGTFLTKVTNLDEKILTLLKTNYFSIENNFDSNAKENILHPIEENNMSTMEQSENIIIVYDEVEEDRKINSLIDSDISCDIHMGASCSYVEMAQQTTDDPVEKTATSLKRDRITKKKLKSIVKEKQVGRQPLVNKKMELIEKKLSILDVIKNVEIENLKLKKIDNEIKEIVKEREKLELKIKQKQYENTLSDNI